MKNKVVVLIRKLFRKIFKKDFVIINKDSMIHRLPGMVIISKTDNNNGYLPVSYNYHTPKKWDLLYEIAGNDAGTLHYSIKVPDCLPFFEITSEVKLPQSWTVKLDGQDLVVNDVIQKVKGNLPLDTLQLFADFKFNSNNSTLCRKVGHRIRLENGDIGENYFNKNVYRSYENESSHYPPEIFSKIEKHHPLNGRLLDVGCATGLLVEYALLHGLEAEGIDYSSWAVEKANKITNGKCRVVDFNKAQKTDFDNLYDIIILNSVLEHLEDPESSLELLFNLCQPKGVVYIQTLNAESLMHQILKSNWGGYTDYTHRSPWISASWIVSTTKRIGFDVLYINNHHVWNDNTYDDIWQLFSKVLKIRPLNVLLEEGYGDIVDIILQHPDSE